MGGHALDIAITMAGLEDGEAEALRAGVLDSTAPCGVADVT